MVRFIADAGSNHNGQLERAVAIIREASKVGCWGVKFQKFNGEIGKDKREWLPTEWLPILYGESHSWNLQFGCSPFYLEAVKELEPYVDSYKIASSQVDNKDLIKACAKIKRPIFVSIPAQTLEKINLICDWIGNLYYSDLIVLYCIPSYPTRVEDCHLRVMGTYELGKWINRQYLGYSDHTRSAAVVYRVVHAWKARFIEFHLDLEDGQGWEYKHGHCWKPSEIAEVIRNVREGFEAD